MSSVCPNGHDSAADDYCDTCGATIDPGARASASGAPDGAAAPSPVATVGPAIPTSQTCPHCGTDNVLESLFCEACGYDFTTGVMPREVLAGVGAAEAESGAAAAQGVPESPGSLEAPESPEAPQSPEAGAGTASGAPTGTATSPPTLQQTIPPTIAMEWVAEVWIDPEWYDGQEAEEPMPSPGLPTIVPLTVRSALIGRVSASKHITPDIDCTTDSGVSRRHAQLTTDGTRWFIEDLGSSNGTFIGDAGGALPEDPIDVGPKRELDDDDRIYVGAWTRIVVRRATDEETAAAAEG